MSASAEFGMTLADELARCGLREVVLAPGSRSTPLAMAFGALEGGRRLRVHMRIDERSAAFTALGLAKASGRPVAIVCTSGTAAANFHPAVIEADESGVPLLVLTADRPPELRGTGANQAIDQIKLYGSAVRWFSEAGVPEPGAGLGDSARYWRSLACTAWAHAAGLAGGFPGPVHLNLPLREPLIPGGGVTAPLGGRPDGTAWTTFAPLTAVGSPAAGTVEIPSDARVLIIAGDGAWGAQGPGQTGPGQTGPGQTGLGQTGLGQTGLGQAGVEQGGQEQGGPERGLQERDLDEQGGQEQASLLAVAERAGWPVLAEPSSGLRRGPNALSAYQYLLGSPEFLAAHQPDVIISAGRPGLSRAQTAFLRDSGARHVVIAQGPDRWADPTRAASEVAGGVRVTGVMKAQDQWLHGWLRADQRVRSALDAELDAVDGISEPRLARDLAAALPEGALLWTGSSLPVRDLDCHMPARADVRVLASRGASGIDGTTSAAIGAALAHQGPAFALLGDLAFVHDAPGLAIGPREPRPDLCLIVVNNDGGGIFSTLEQAAFPGFERLFGTPHGTGLHHLAAAFGVPYHLLDHPDDLAKAIQGRGLRIVEVRTDRAQGADLRAHLRATATRALP